jgi:hypothetical protein
MYKIEITADTLSELAGKIMSLAVKLHPTANVERVYAPPAEINPVAPATPAPVAELPALSFEKDVAPIVLRAVATKGKPFVEGIMTQFGVERASQLPAERWPELITHLEEAPF